MALAALMNTSTTLNNNATLSLPIHGAFHAAHLPEPDIGLILGSSELWDRPIPPPIQYMLACGIIAQESSRTLGDILTDVIHNILQRPLDFVKLVKDLQYKAKTMCVQITSLGPAHVNMLKRALSPSKIERFGSPTAISRDPSAEKNEYHDAIAIVGMACRVPGAQNVDELWELLLQEKDMHRQIPPDRFDVRTHYDPSGDIRNTTITQWGCFDDCAGDFDLSLFKMSPREALQTDQCHRLMLITGYEALQDAGYSDFGSKHRPKFGTFYGQAADDYRQVNSGQNIDTNYVTGGIRAFAPGRVSYYFGWEGPSMSIDTACSSSAVAINQACSSLRLGECDMALAGGVNLLTSSELFAGLSRARFVSTTGPCKTLDDTADGYCRGDGAGSIVIKRYRDALRDNDNVLGVIRSIETAHAGTAISITHPEAETQTSLFQNVLSKVGMDACDIDHIEMHGTGTQAGDLAETTSVAGLVKAAAKPRPATRPLTIASVKPNVGHSEAASGVTSLIKALLMFKHHINPKHIGIKTRFNPKLLPLADMGIEVPLKHETYTPTTDKRRILVNNFNATGGVTAMVVEEHCPQPNVTSDPRHHYPVVISAANQKSLRKSLENMLNYLESKPGIEISHLSYSLSARRLHHSWCFAYVANTISEIIQRLRQELTAPVVLTTGKRSAAKPLIFVFTGQAVSSVGMGNVLFKTNDTFRQHIEHSDALCRNMGLPSFLRFIDQDGAEDSPNFSTAQTHLALVALEIALAHLFETWGIVPSYVLGHSLGEYSALCTSNALSVADTLYLVGKRAQLLEAHCRKGEYSMVATALSPENVRQELSTFPGCQIACYNGPSQTVISGESDQINSLSRSLIQKGMQAKILPLDYAFHSAQMDAILQDYERVAKGVSFCEPSIPMVSTYLGDVIHLEQLSSEYLSCQTRQPVKFHQSIKCVSSFHSEDLPLWMELGPAPACTPFISIILGTTDTVNVLNPKEANWRTISDAVAKYYTSIGTPRWDYFHQQYVDALRLIRTPAYSFDMSRFWIEYEGNWTITKNQSTYLQGQMKTPTTSVISSTLCRLESDVDPSGKRTLVSSSDLLVVFSDEGDSYITVNGCNLAACSVYADMAMTAASELYKKFDRGSGVPTMELSSMVVGEYRNIESQGERRMRVVAVQDESDWSTATVSITLSYGGKIDRLAECKVVCVPGILSVSDAEEKSFLYRSRMDLLEMFHRNTFNFPAPTIETHLDEATDLQEVILNPGSKEAIANWVFVPTKGDFMLNPGWLNALAQLARFVISQEGSQCTLINVGSLRLFVPLQPEMSYRAHVRLSDHAEFATVAGDIHVFDNKGALIAEIKKLVLRLIGDAAVSRVPKQRPTLPRCDSSQAGLTLSTHPTSPDKSTPSTPDIQKSILPASPVPAIPLTSVVDLQTKADLSSSIDSILSILASELGVDLFTINQNEPLEELGVDSIMAMTLLVQMQKSIGDARKLPGTLLVQHNSFSKLRLFLETW
jgi:acyl transferase domain-containing protein